MEYLLVERKGPSDLPSLMYSELDEERWEVRKVYVFSDGSFGYANVEIQRGTMVLSEQVTVTVGLSERQIRTPAELNKDPQFNARKITASEFESVWQNAVSGGMRLHGET